MNNNEKNISLDNKLSRTFFELISGIDLSLDEKGNEIRFLEQGNKVTSIYAKFSIDANNNYYKAIAKTDISKSLASYFKAKENNDINSINLALKNISFFPNIGLENTLRVLGLGDDAVKEIDRCIQETKAVEFSKVLNEMISKEYKEKKFKKIFNDKEKYLPKKNDNNHFNKILRGEKVPSVKLIIKISIAFKLSGKQLMDLLAAAGNFYPTLDTASCTGSSKKNESLLVKIAYYLLENHIYDIYSINKILTACGLKELF